MLESTPLNCLRKPGEPGGEKARERKAVLQGLRSTTQIWLTKEDGGPGTQYLTDVLALIDEALSEAGALAALEAVTVGGVPFLLDASKQLLEACYQADAREDLAEEIDGSLLDGVRDALIEVAKLKQALERAAEGAK